MRDATQPETTHKFGTPAVYFTAIATLFGAILFLRFGYAVGTVGLWGVFILIIVGNMVTIPTALAISELATNKRVEGEVSISSSHAPSDSTSAGHLASCSTSHRPSASLST